MTAEFCRTGESPVLADCSWSRCRRDEPLNDLCLAQEQQPFGTSS